MRLMAGASGSVGGSSRGNDQRITFPPRWCVSLSIPLIAECSLTFGYNCFVAILAGPHPPSSPGLTCPSGVDRLRHGNGSRAGPPALFIHTEVPHPLFLASRRR